jgi:hypothetical protein
LRSAWAKSSEDPLSTNKNLDIVVHACHPSYAGSINRRIMVQAGQSIKARPYLKNSKSKKDPGVAQVVRVRVPAWQTQGPGNYQRKKKKAKLGSG